jgi:hypothetical protein
MIADEPNPRPCIGTPDAELLNQGAFYQAIVCLIEQELPVWRDRPLRPPFQDEPKLNQSLCLHLDSTARHRGFDSIRFVQEGIQAGSRRTDIGVMVPGTIIVEGRDYEDFIQLLPIECKRLPTPPDKRRSDFEYIHGLAGHRSGAIERFKYGLHGPTNQQAMIIAYVQEQSFKHWQTTINHRLRKLADDHADEGLWEPTELLSVGPTPPSAICQKLGSNHQRLQPPASSPHVQIEHLWLLMN